MKKLLYMLVLFCVIFLNACETNNARKISKGEKVIGKCCKEISAGNSKVAGELNEDEEKRPPNVSAVLPSSFWDTKSMIW